jgi:hypothetical protein
LSGRVSSKLPLSIDPGQLQSDVDTREIAAEKPPVGAMVAAWRSRARPHSLFPEPSANEAPRAEINGVFCQREAILLYANNKRVLKETSVLRGARVTPFSFPAAAGCRTEQEAEAVRAELQARLAVCGLQMHPTKTKIVYCKDNRRRRTYPNVKFDFLGYQFRPRRVATSQRREIFCGYTPAVSPTALKSMRATIRSLHIPRQTPGTLAEIAQQINPLLRGWIGYYGRFSGSALSSLVDYVNQKLKAWSMRKYKRFRFHKTRASLFLRKLARDNAELFVHWQLFGTTTFT